MSYIRVCEQPGTKAVELPSEDDDSLPVETLQAQFPGAVGLKYLPDPDSDVFRGVRCSNGKMKPPKEGWEDIVFYCVYPAANSTDQKRKLEVADTGAGVPTAKKHSGPREVKCADLIILGLNWSTTEESLKNYFEDKFGPLLMTLVKTDPYSKRSKGFGFIRFLKYEDQVKALSARKHEIDGRWVTIKPPYAKEGVESSLPSKVFLSRLTPSMTNEDLSEYFSKYGEVADVFFPRTPFRGFAFLTFVSPESADQACEEEPHIVKGTSVSVVHATDQQKKPSYSEGSRGSFRGRGGRGRGSYSGHSRYDRGSNYGSSRDNYRDNYDDYDSYDRRGGYDNYSGPPREDISKILAAALNNPNAINNLLNNLGDKRSGPNGMTHSNRDYDREYTSSGSDYKDYSYSDKGYNAYTKDKGYGPSKYSGGGGNSDRY